jgi:hypothetical protein
MQDVEQKNTFYVIFLSHSEKTMVVNYVLTSVGLLLLETGIDSGG